ncbi:hypothetical protein ACWWJS_26560, partial [Enterobacter cloacae]
LASGYSYSKGESDGKYQPKGKGLLGNNQKWIDVTKERKIGEVYTNNSEGPIYVLIWSDGRAVEFKLDGILIKGYSSLDNCS